LRSAGRKALRSFQCRFAPRAFTLAFFADPFGSLIELAEIVA